MENKNSNQSAFVVPIENLGYTNQLELTECNGLTKREYAAIKVAQGLCANSTTAVRRNSILVKVQSFFIGEGKQKSTVGDAKDYARVSIEIADELLKQLEKQ